ncbi:uncharacterized protein LOC133524892 [Cydia pomonella]|uniref:uncharacterized protein LOC133524892 n=1 Tax=Cydia pomonella TaxID=82600 RepID=UPI002ADE7780|nr:uncharacterized protein LOC133524892 [Cydia pomonella]
MAKFLDDVYKPKMTKTTIMITDESEDDSKDERDESIQNLESSEEQDIAFKTPKIIPKKKRKLDETQNRMDEAYTYLKQLGQTSRKDVSSLYCDLLAEKLRGLQDDTREVAMLEIDNLVFNLKRREKEQQFHQPSYYSGATAIIPLRPLSPYHSPQDSPSSSSYSPAYQSNPHTPSQAPYIQTIPNPQQSLSIQSPQGSPSFPPPFHSQPSSASQSPVYQSPNPHTPSQAPYIQTIPNPQQSLSIQSPQGSPSFPPPFHSQPSSASQSPVYQSPNPHTPSQAPYIQTIPNPQQSLSIQSPQGSPSFPPPFHSQPSSASQSPAYQSPNPHTPSQAPYTQTIPNPQKSPSTNQTSDNISLKDFYESQNVDFS